MMVIRVVLKVKPEQEAAFAAFLADESAAVRQLDGCLRYALFKATDAEHTYLLYEEWASQAAFDAYKAGPLLKKSFEVLGPMMAGPPDSAYFTADKVG
jgi:quinol monooxygenase YgiN